MFVNPHNNGILPQYNVWERKDALGVIRAKKLDQAAIQSSYVVLESMGSPLTLWKKFTDREHCFCWDTQYQQANKRCEVCGGTGFLDGYRKYGYRDDTYAITSLDAGRLTGNNCTTIGDPGKPKIAIIINQGTSAYVDTEWISLTNVKEVDFIKSGIGTPPNTNIMYEYTFDGSNFNILTDLSNLTILNASLPGNTQIKFRVELNRQSISTQSPGLIYLRIRMRIAPKLVEINTRQFIDIPAFLASKSYTPRSQEIGEDGLVKLFPLSFWTLNDCKVDEHDLAKFLRGPYEGKWFETLNVRYSSYGGNDTLLSSHWDTRFIQNSGDIMGIVYDNNYYI